MRFAFISRMESHRWGGSEELWSRTALRLRAMGHEVIASVKGWEGAKASRLEELERAGGEIQYRWPENESALWKRGLRKLPGDPFRLREKHWAEKIADRIPDLVLISDGMNSAPRDLCHTFAARGIRFAMVMQSAAETFWPTDYEVEKAKYIHERAAAVYFVSEGNRRLTKTQYVGECHRVEIVRNPFNVNYDTVLPWPESSETWKLAFVGRLEPEAKGCDILLEVLSLDKWRARDLTVSFYGKGHSAKSVKKCAELLGLANVRFPGHVSDVSTIWKEHLILVLPSRHEGMPLAMVEAMLCGRPCIVTDAGGSAELIEDNATGFIAQAANDRYLDEAMERAWQARADWRKLGEQAGLSVRRMVPRDPAEVFANKLIALSAGATKAKHPLIAG